ncbi:protein serine/threonine phosphatase 2C [Serendipita vermifera]|nr:protein serine/threonine phosphatase 2C [Serendipita vermifera]
MFLSAANEHDLNEKQHPKLPRELARPPINPMPFAESPNARSKTITVADGPNTGGALNQHPSHSLAFDVGVAEDKGTRRTMEDAHSFVHLLESLHNHPDSKIPSILNKTFHAVDGHLSQMAAEQKTHSGCTAVTAFLRIEDEDGKQSFLQSTTSGAPLTDEPNPNRPISGSKIRTAMKNITSRLGSRGEESSGSLPVVKGSRHAPFEPNWVGEGNGSGNGKKLRRVLYAANAGDARAVLCRNGQALRLTYDHKGSDAQESKRITDAGGFVMNNRVNGVLAVTRSLGDSAMKDFVVGAPYTTETELGAQDEFLIMACDGLWDVTEDQEAVNLVRDKQDAQQMAKSLLEHALVKFSTDNVTVLVVRFKNHNGSPSSSSAAVASTRSSTVKSS